MTEAISRESSIRCASLLLALLFGSALLACGGDEGAAIGSEGGPCYGNGTCDTGLVCTAAGLCAHDTEGPCAGVSCSDHGTCAIAGGDPVCACDDGYHAEGLTCIEDGTTGPCDGVTCSGHGTCALVSGDPTCACDGGYHAEGLTCIEDGSVGPCDGVSCSGHGICAIVDDDPVCACDEGYHAEGLSCVEDGSTGPCDGVTCSGHGSCADVGGDAVCLCDPGYHADGLACLEDTGACGSRICYVDEACIPNGASCGSHLNGQPQTDYWYARDTGNGQCVFITDCCDELYMCESGALGGSCGGNESNLCEPSFGCSSCVQSSSNHICTSQSNCASQLDYGNSCGNRICYIDESCIPNGASCGSHLNGQPQTDYWYARNTGNGQCVFITDCCDELYMCESGAQGGSCGGNESNLCEPSFGCSSCVQNASNHICTSQSNCASDLDYP